MTTLLSEIITFLPIDVVENLTHDNEVWFNMCNLYFPVIPPEHVNHSTTEYYRLFKTLEATQCISCVQFSESVCNKICINCRMIDHR